MTGKEYRYLKYQSVVSTFTSRDTQNQIHIAYIHTYIHIENTMIKRPICSKREAKPFVTEIISVETSLTKNISDLF